MLSFIALLSLGLVFPALWGLLVHRLVDRFWPRERRYSAVWVDSPPNEMAPEFPDYQI
jgi:hypothetical protein